MHVEIGSRHKKNTLIVDNNIQGVLTDDIKNSN